MRWLALIGALLLWPALAVGQSAQIEALLERQLSGDGRIIEIDGFSGALSSQAQMAQLRISDDAGLWLQLDNVVLDWDRSALLRGRLDVRALTAERLQVLRAPQSEPSAPSTQASGFRIPDLPIAIRVDRFALELVEIGAPLLGTAVTARLEAEAALDDTGVSVKLLAERLDTQAGQVQLDLSFARADEVLGVTARINEPPGGVLAEALDLPGRPAVALNILGSGPLDAFEADIALATDGSERLAGAVSIEADGGGRRFGADLAGDIRPLLQPDTQAFFGADTRVAVSGLAAADGALDLQTLTVRTAQLQADGSARLDADRAPQQLDLDLLVQGQGPVRLPGSDVALGRADLNLTFDAAEGPDWRVTGNVAALDAGDIVADAVTLDATGEINPGTATPFSGAVRLEAEGVDAPPDPALAAVIGPRLRLQTDVAAAADGAISLRALTLETPHATARGLVDVTPTDGRVQVAVDVAADVPALAPFSEIAGLPLEGTVTANVTAEAELPGGAIAVTLEGQSQRLDIGQPVIAPLISPDTQLAFAIRRDDQGTRIERLTLENREVSLQGTGSADEADGALSLTASLRDAALIDDRLPGPADITATLSDLQETQAVTADLSTGFGLALEVDGTLGGAAPAIRFDGTLAEVARFVPVLEASLGLRGRLDLAGPHPVLGAALVAEPGIALDVAGTVSGPDAALRFDARLDDLGAFAAPLQGPARATGELDISGPTLPVTATLEATPGIEAQIAGPLISDSAPLAIDATMADLGPLVAALPGPATVQANLRDLNGLLQVDARLTATPGIAATVQGQPLGDASALDVTVNVANLRPFVPQLPGPAAVRAQLRDLAGAQEVNATLTATSLRTTVSGSLDSQMDVQARLDSLQRFAPGLSGGANLTAALRDLRAAPSVNVALRTDTGASADVAGRVGLGTDPSDLRITAALPLGIASGFVGNRSISGDAGVNLQLSGPLALSSVSGQVQVQNARLFDPGTGFTVSGLAATANLRGARADLQAQGTANGGTLNITGGVGLTAPFATDVQVQANDLIYALDGLLQTRVGAALAITGPATQRIAISGQVDLFDTEVRVPDTGLGGATPIPEIRHEGASGAVRQTRQRAGLVQQGGGAGGGGGPLIPLDIQITAGDPIFVRGRGLDAEFDGALQIRGTARAPEPVGQFLLQRGRLDFLGRRLDLTEGVIVAAGSAIPRLRVVAETILDDLTARITVEGPANAPDVTISATPDLPQDEVLARLLFGRSIDTLSPFQVARLVASVRTLAGGGSGLVEATRQRLNFDNLDIRTDETGATELAIGQRLSEDVYSEVELDSKGDVQLNLNLDVGANTRLRGSVTNTGETGVGIFWERDY
ncbi:MAG: translocation/assembly module TamB domain-containing protein [Pseudomonadota bacterium]